MIDNRINIRTRYEWNTEIHNILCIVLDQKLNIQYPFNLFATICVDLLESSRVRRCTAYSRLIDLRFRWPPYASNSGLREKKSLEWDWLYDYSIHVSSEGNSVDFQLQQFRMTTGGQNIILKNARILFPIFFEACIKHTTQIAAEIDLHNSVSNEPRMSYVTYLCQITLTMTYLKFYEFVASADYSASLISEVELLFRNKSQHWDLKHQWISREKDQRN